MNVRYLQAMALLVFVSSAAQAQQLQIQPGWSGYQDADLAVPSDNQLSFTPSVEVGRYQVQFEGQPEVYGMDQWSGVDPKMDRIVYTDRLAFYFDAPWDTSMKQRVREANVVDEEAIFPVQQLEVGFCRSIRVILPTPKQPPVFEPVVQCEHSDRYEPSMKDQDSYVIIDLAESEHLGMVPGSWRP